VKEVMANDVIQGAVSAMNTVQSTSVGKGYPSATISTNLVVRYCSTEQIGMSKYAVAFELVLHPT
jgi:hypothetical protein